MAHSVTMDYHIKHKVFEMLHMEQNLSEDTLLQILSNDLATDNDFDFTSIPVLIGLHYYSVNASRSLRMKPNKILKKLVDFLFPLCTISRADRLERKIKSLLLKAHDVENLNEYLETRWKPQPTGCFERYEVTEELQHHNFTPQVLEALLQKPDNNTWTLCTVPSIQFYADLQLILKKRRIDVERIGTIYRSIDPYIRRFSASSKDAYQLVTKLVNTDGSSTQTCTRFKVYEIHHKFLSQENVQLQNKLEQQKRIIDKQATEIKHLKLQLNELQCLVKDSNSEIRNLNLSVYNLEHAYDELVLTLNEHDDIFKEREKMFEAETITLREKVDELTCQSSSTMENNQYSKCIRELYYTLLSMRLPLRQVENVVRAVGSHLMPQLNIQNARLPKKSCAAYLRSDELAVISRAHKARKLIGSKKLNLSSDGTTLHQKKKAAFLLNDVIMGVVDVANGTSKVEVEALQSELEKLNHVAESLSYNGDRLSVDRIVASTSDGASTQAKFNKILEDKCGKAIVENKCGMHLGVNLCKAQMIALARYHKDVVNDNESDVSNESDENDDDVDENANEELESSSDIDQSPVQKDDVEDMQHLTVDRVVHEVAKLFGHCGTPEYCHGAQTFRLFLLQKSQECRPEDKAYYESAMKVFLKRQVGSRYYVTSYNAGCIFFLTKAIVAFLKEQLLIKQQHNRLEASCYKSLQNSVVLATLRLEGLLFDKVYSRLLVLVKSKKLNKSSLDMNEHYEELVAFLNILTDKPHMLLDRSITCFNDEPRLCCHDDVSAGVEPNWKTRDEPVRDMLYCSADHEDHILLPMISVVAKAMNTKLKSYMKNHLPGGDYYEPTPEEKEILSSLHPHNDKSESVFGCNDWLSRVLQNMAQATRSVVIEVNYNKTMRWLMEQDQEEKEAILALAKSERKQIQAERKEEERVLVQHQLAERKKLIQKGIEKQLKISSEIEKLKSDPLLTSIDALNKRVAAVNSLSLPLSVKEAELKALVKRQSKLRFIAFHQKHAKIAFTEKGICKSASQLLEELSSVIKNNPLRVEQKDQATTDRQLLYVLFDKPTQLVGVQFIHQYEDEETSEKHWYDATITSYQKKAFNVYYPATGENCSFSVNDLKEDFACGDLRIV